MKHLFPHGTILTLLGLLLTILVSTCWGQTATASLQAEQLAKIEENWGVQIVSLRRTAGGHMLDFRYKVINPEKAAPLFVRQTKPYLIHQDSGKSLAVPNMAKVGPLRTSDPPKEGRIYWMFFGNPGLVQAGDKVSVVIGDFKVENLIVK